MTKEKLQDKIRVSLVGGAIGDAFGFPVEFVSSFEEIRTKYGEDGVVEFDKSYPWLDDYLRYYKALFSDDTQMTRFTLPKGYWRQRRMVLSLCQQSAMPISHG